ncbi:MAG: rhamnulokinase family protein [Verrucomicrobiia bacterium]
MKSQYLACDLGAESGRVILGTLENGCLALEEIHRFPNGPVRVLGSLRWNVLGMYAQLKEGLALGAAKATALRSLSVDSWGVDYVYIRHDQPHLSVPFHYRDARTDTAFLEATKRVPRKDIFENTGIQFMPLNTLYQLYDDLERQPEVIKLATRFLCIGDYLNYLFSGRDVMERSLASTTQLFDPRLGEWSKKLIKSFGFREQIFPDLVDAGSVTGPVLPDVAVECGLPLDVAVAAVPSHDTACAVAAVPAEGEDWAYLSSGTWSLLGLELERPIITPESFEANFTNEVGLNRSIRFLKNIAGLWILQECRRTWASRGEKFEYAELVSAAEGAEAFRSLIDPQDPAFLKPGEMPSRVAAYCEKTGQPVPTAHGEIVRCILESLALVYSLALEQAMRLSGRSVKKLHVVGGGSRNHLLNQFTASACGITVLAGPEEATAAGNVLVQALACGELKSSKELRQVVGRSFEVKIYNPVDIELWQEARNRFVALTS